MMNYWHIQLHPNEKNRFTVETIKEVLKIGVIGMSYEWQDKHGNPVADPKDFREIMKVGDIVMVRDSITPVALVEIISDWFRIDKTNENLDWFDLRRGIRILDYFDEDIKVIQAEVLNEYGNNYFQAMGTLSRCANENATSTFIKKWYKISIKKNLMAMVILKEQRVQEIKKLWESYQSKINDNDINLGNSSGTSKTINDAVQEQLDNWKIYRDKIANSSLTIHEYTNRKINEVELPGSYLCNFLERTTRYTFGSSKPGNANNFEVKRNDGDESYTIRTLLKKGESENQVLFDEANKFYIDNVKVILERIVKSSSDLINQITVAEDNNYPAKQLLRKMVVLDHPYEFLNIYSDDVINQLHSEFLDTDTESNLGKNHEIRTVLNEIFNLENNNRTNFLISRFIWQYATSKGIADKDSPNVILYGPPGTGKTYSIRQNLDFVCQGDSSRYKIVQFHPSFTYEDFIEGIKPSGMTKDGNINFRLVNGGFKKFCIEARKELVRATKAKEEPKEFFYVVDEINRANLSAVFGETLVCIEKEYRDDGLTSKNLIKTQYSSLLEDTINSSEDKQKQDAIELAYHYENGEAYFGIPSNIRFIGMMNDVDKSIDAFDLALRRRFKWIRKDCDYEVIADNITTTKNKSFSQETVDKYVKSCEDLNKYISSELGLGKSYEFGHSFFMQISKVAATVNITEGNMQKLFELYLSPTLKEYLRSMYSESELETQLKKAMDHFVKLFRSKKD